MKKFVCVITILILGCALPGVAQYHSLSGKIVTFNKFPLVKVKVVARKSKQEVTTDDQGRFTIQTKKNDILIIEANGFESFRKTVHESDKNIRVNLIFEDKKKNKSAVLEAGYISREDLNYGLENLAADNSIYSNFTDIFDAVKYALPTVSIIVEGGKRKIQFRGVRSAEGSNAALTVVDGVPVDDISYINPAELKSIKLLSSSQAAIYGSRGGNGVVVIMTK